MIDTPIGELMLIQSDKGLRQIVFEKKIPVFKSQIELNKNRFHLGLNLEVSKSIKFLKYNFINDLLETIPPSI